MPYTCKSCGDVHADLPMSFHADLPAAANTLPEAEWATRIDCDGELCIIDDEYFFVHAVLELPVTDAPAGGEGPFVWGVWVSLSEKAFDRTVAHWEDPAREQEPPYFGWLSTALPYLPATLNLKAHVHTRAVGERPYVVLEASDHPLALEQQRGITLARVQAIAEGLRHGGN